MKLMRKNFLISILYCVFLTISFNCIAQKSYLIDSMFYDINNVLPKNWNVKKVNDSILVVERI